MESSAARAIVKEIADQHGHLGEDVLTQMPPEVRRQVEEALLKKDEMIGSSVITLAKNLYNSSARFVFELLQNADDNSYHAARSAARDPFVSFRVYDRYIVVECNEDGFTRENLVAICNVGKSSKTAAQGYIGEKGIGFKSVFMVAWKVHIQSREFSFSFCHRMGDSGMGMISPVWEETEEVLPHPLTRITLFLHEGESDEAMARQRETTLQQFRELKATFLLFMKNIRRIDVRLYDGLEVEVLSTVFSLKPQQEGRVELEQKTVLGEELQQSTQYYYTTKITVSNIPKSENRQYTEAELSNRAYSATDVILAFPLTQDSMPLIEPQEVYAFLPVRNMGLPFLIQADFVTDASRQDIVKSSARNIAILPVVALAFIETVKRFCAHPTLAYQWMRYLPPHDWNSQDSLWKGLTREIDRQLQVTPTMWTRSLKGMRTVHDVRLVPLYMRDRHGEPLVPDLVLEQYLSSRYLQRDLTLLQNYGLRMMSKSEILERLGRDVENDGSSIMRNPNTDNDWHSRVAKILISLLKADPAGMGRRIKILNLIPLIGGEWRASRTCGISPIYFHKVHGYPLPTDGPFNLVEPSAESNPVRKQLFELLCVKKASVQEARSRIIGQDKRWTPHVATSRSYLQFLYLTDHLDRDNDFGLVYNNVRPFNSNNTRLPLSHGVYYFPGDGPYSPQQLLAGFDPGDPSRGANDLRPVILHHEYMRDCPEKPAEEAHTWESWLSVKLKIHNAIPLTRIGRISEECLYVATSFPEKFMSFLLKSWKSEQLLITGSPTATKQLLDLEVLCEDGTMYPLGETYIRTDLTKIADTLLREGDFFPWLKIDPSIDDSAEFAKIDVLAKALHFGHPKTELDFYLSILFFVASASVKRGQLLNNDRVFDLYARIETRCQESASPNEAQEVVRSVFEEQRLVYVREYDRELSHWGFPHECLWEAPSHMQCFHPLKKRYEGVANQRTIQDLFQNTLRIRDAGIDDFLLELEWKMKKPGDCDFDQVYDIYRELDKRRPQMDGLTVREIREQFENSSFVYLESADGKKWHKPSECLWSTVTDIKGMVALNDVYEELSEFFIDLLSVRTLTLQMVHDKLVEQGSRQSSVEEVKETIWHLNSYMQSESNLPDPRRVLTARIFPVRYPNGSVELCSGDLDFAIADRKHLMGLFSGNAKILDFNVNEIARLEPFLRWLGLNKRYLSSSVKEISSLRGDSSRSLTLPDRNIARKAHGLLRIAVHFRSPRISNGEQAFFDLLKDIEVRETDGISSELHLNQDGTDIKVEVSQCEIHFQEVESQLMIFVPRDEQSQYLCFLDRIPRALVEWIMTEPSTGICEPFNDKALDVMSKVLQADRKYMGLTLDRAGIMSIETPDDWVVDDDTASDDTSVVEAIQTVRAEFATLDDDGVSTTTYEGPSTPSLTSSRSLFTPQGTPGTEYNMSTGPEIAHQSLNIAYLGLLRSVVTAARASTFPSRGSFDMAALAHSLSSSHWTFQLLGVERTLRDRMIGAAGELYVFEVLSNLDPIIPDFSRNNWQSTIRKYVNIHEDYTNLEPWRGRETADLTYPDYEGTFTSMLIDKGYLNETWTEARPFYFLEVKSTTHSFKTPFYMSKSQYERMQTMADADYNPDHDCVYVIFRVYNLGRRDVGMKVYVNPGLMKERGELLFGADTWTVEPRFDVTFRNLV
ncbi:uncharacterized protein BDV17DRAFT_301281 [Aspergillus undulatus]|uniref:uncharacterized protein n=1 Tax=Aspergillus undulatus TaxID=1810928 RepID=UPI003CCDFE16